MRLFTNIHRMGQALASRHGLSALTADERYDAFRTTLQSVCAALTTALRFREKACQIDRLKTLLADIEQAETAYLRLLASGADEKALAAAVNAYAKVVRNAVETTVEIRRWSSQYLSDMRGLARAMRQVQPLRCRLDSETRNTMSTARADLVALLLMVRHKTRRVAEVANLKLAVLEEQGVRLDTSHREAAYQRAGLVYLRRAYR